MPLTQQRAEERGKVIVRNSISYNFHIVLAGQSYQGLAEIIFSLSNLPAELVVDFKGTTKNVLVNGEQQEVKTNEGFIYIDVGKLKIGENSLAIEYQNEYNNDGSGCVSFVDVDTKQYIYTQFEPYYANRVFPCFDQPDLKAGMRLNVISPKAWKKVLSNEYSTIQKEFNREEYLNGSQSGYNKELSSFLEGKDGNMTLFPVTKLLPTYLYCFIAGQYLEYKLDQEKTYNNIPMSLYCIESLYEHMKQLAPFIFEITIESMRFFEEFFGYKYAFNKYDQIFAHQYKWGAMENAGVVTFNDLYIFKEKVSTQRMLSFANTISHELAHHWFGNLVTMKWWDDLWLNESFADFISHFCLEKIKHNVKTLSYQSAMASFLQRKGWGYAEDQMITTHPIRGQVANTSVADSIFDGITYSKGAATMKQLLFLMKEENFSKALSQYFHKYEWTNATIDDYLAEMQNHFSITQFSLKEWRQLWLDKASLNQIEASWNPADESNQAIITIHQTPYTSDHPTLRLHKIKVGLFKQDFSVDVIEVLIRPEELTKTTYNGSQKYKAILLNFEDQTFAKNIIDSISLDFFVKNINSITDILSRTLIWRSFFEMVKDAKMTSHKFVDVVTGALAAETSDSIFERQFDFVHASINSYTPQKLRPQLNSRMFKYIYELIPKIGADKQNRIVILKGKLVSFAYSEEEIKIILNWLNKKDQLLKAHEISIGQKWSTVVKAFTLKNLSLEQKEAIFAQVNSQDKSDTAKNKRLTCDSLIASKEKWLQLYNSFKDKNNKNSITAKGFIAAGLNHHVHSQILLQNRENYYKDILQVSEQLEGDHFAAFYQNFEPIDDDLEYQITEYSKIQLPPGKCDKHTRDILKIIDQLKRRANAYKLYANIAPNL